MITSIEIQNLKLQAFHGALPQERSVGNLYRIDLSVDADIAQAVVTDRLQHTINYAEVIEVIRTEMSLPSSLLEHVGGRIVGRLLERWPAITHYDLRIAKLTPPVKADVEACAVRFRG